MKFKDLTDADKQYIRQVHGDASLPWQTRMNMLLSRFNTTERTLRRWVKDLGFSQFTEELGTQLVTARNRVISGNKYYIISAAQNGSHAHLPFLDNIKAYANYLGAEIHIIPIRYKNPTSVFTDRKHDVWDPVFDEILTFKRVNLHKLVTLAGDVKIQPTASDPLSGFEGLSGDSSTVFGHTRVHLKSLPVLDGHPFKFLMTTGAVTLANYTDSKAGKKGEFHHTFGFVIVEVKDKDTAFIRQVTAHKDGSFHDLLYSVKDGVVTKEDGVEAFIMGDLHSFRKNEELFERTLQYLPTLNPKNVILHDVFDGFSITHHERKDPIKNYHKMVSGQNLVKKDVEATLKDIETLLPYKPIVVKSNHDEWLDRWVVDQDWKKELHNSVEYMKYTAVLLSKEADNGVLPYMIKERFGDKVTCLKYDQSYKILGWEIANHGHLGANGSKGNIEQYRKLNTKVIVGDWHQANRKDGALSLGTHSILRAGFNKGPSSWNHADVIINKNGKAQHLIFLNNEFTTLL